MTQAFLERDPSSGQFVGTASTLERFWSKVGRSQDPEACWGWKGHVAESTGYGMFAESHTQSVLAHRRAWEIASGAPVPPGMMVLHTCDFRPCVRNDGQSVYLLEARELPRFGHLFLGTALDNKIDERLKGRTAKGLRNGAYVHPERVRRGENHGMTKLTDAQRAEMRVIYQAGGITQRELGRRFGVCQYTVWMAVK